MQTVVALTDLPKLAKRISRKLSGGDVVTLSGELASGKTTFTKHLVEALGYPGRVSSPSFVIERRYPLKNRKISEVVHLDLYRLNAEDLHSFDWKDHLGHGKTLTIIEWPEVGADHLPSTAKQIRLEIIDDQTRRFTFSPNFGD